MSVGVWGRGVGVVVVEGSRVLARGWEVWVYSAGRLGWCGRGRCRRVALCRCRRVSSCVVVVVCRRVASVSLSSCVVVVVVAGCVASVRHEARHMSHCTGGACFW